MISFTVKPNSAAIVAHINIGFEIRLIPMPQALKIVISKGIQEEQKVEREQVAKVTGTNKDNTPKVPVKSTDEKVYPNDPCPCGSGKKYKQCCGRKA